MENVQNKAQELLGSPITKFTFLGKGACNNTYYIETESGDRLTVKEGRVDKEIEEQNSLSVEATVLRKLRESGIETPVPEVAFVSEDPQMYGYRYIEGTVLKTLWPDMPEEQKVLICEQLGFFHAELGKRIPKEIAESIGVEINGSIEPHPEVLEDYGRIMSDEAVPEEFKVLAKRARDIFNDTADKVIFQFLHNDAHHENVLIQDGKISGIIDFGDAEYGEIAKEFSRYIRDFPYHFQHIVAVYEKHSGNILSYQRLVTNSYISGLIDTVEHYKAGGERREKALKALERYAELIG